jgi:hypothetical protein
MKPINFFTESALTMGPALGARRVSRRKYRLFAVACCRAGFERITHPDCRALVELVERWADDESLGKEVSALRRRVHAWAKQPPFGFSRWLGIFGAYHAAAPTGAPVPGFIYPRKNRAARGHRRPDPARDRLRPRVAHLRRGRTRARHVRLARLRRDAHPRGRAPRRRLRRQGTARALP